MKQKYTIGRHDVWLREIGGTKNPIQEVEIIGFEQNKDKCYRIRYQKKGAEDISIEDVEEFRLINLPDGLLQAILHK